MVSYHSATDEQLLRYVGEGNARAFEELYNRYWSTLYNTAYKRVKNAELCKDIVQEVFADLWSRRKQVQIENPAAYLHVAVRFQLFKQISRGVRMPAFTGLFDLVAAPSFSPGDRLLEKELRELIEAWAETLPKKRRRIFLLHYNWSVSTREIARELGISRKTVQNQLNTSLQSLRKQLARFLTILFLLCLVFILQAMA